MECVLIPQHTLPPGAKDRWDGVLAGAESVGGKIEPAQPSIP